MSAFPRTRSYPRSSSLNLVCCTSKGQKPGMPRKVSEKNFTSSVSNSNNVNQRESNKKTKQKEFTCVSGLQTKCNSQELNKATESQLQQNNLDYMTKKKIVTLECEKNNPEESTHG